MPLPLTLDGSCDTALRWLGRRLSKAGLRALRTFDLHDARLATANCPCPHHGSADCDCQMVVLLVYGPSARPATLMLHSNDGQTWLSLVNTPSQPVEVSMRASIERALEINPSMEGL
jgi:hypothetical protein